VDHQAENMCKRGNERGAVLGVLMMH